MNTQEITLPAVCAKNLKSCLSGPGWATTPLDIYCAGRLDAEDIIKLPPESKKPTSDEWFSIPVKFPLTDAEKSACRKCLEYNVSKGRMFANQWTAKLLAVFLPEPDNVHQKA